MSHRGSLRGKQFEWGDAAAPVLGPDGDLAYIIHRVEDVTEFIRLKLLGSEHLDITGVARQRSVTPRYVQMLFESEGTTFSEYVLEQRLTRAHRMLTDLGLRNWTISAIAFEVGFGNLSYFNRVFRRRFGATPSDVRTNARLPNE